MTSSPRIDRRRFLRGVGACLALPWLEGLPRAFASPEAEGPARAVWIFVPNGVNRDAWTPPEGALGQLPPSLIPVGRFRSRLRVWSGLDLDGAKAHGDGPGDHARASAAFLTCAHPRKTGGSDLQAGVSIDQVAAQRIGDRTRIDALHLGCEGARPAGVCDSGYSCAYSSHVSWRTPSDPSTKEIDPRAVFQRLFETDRLSPAQRAARDRRRASVLDAVRDEARDLSERLGHADRDRLDNYLEGVRAAERRLDTLGGPPPVPPGVQPPRDTPEDRGGHARLMIDMLVLALQTDQTRIATFMLGNAGSNRSFPEIDVPDGHHGLSHHGGDEASLEKIQRIDAFYTTQLAYLLSRLDETREGDRSLLDRTQVLYGSGIGDGNRHDHTDLPILQIGGGVPGGVHTRAPRGTPLANLYLTVLDHLGVRESAFADSTGRVSFD